MQPIHSKASTFLEQGRLHLGQRRFLEAAKSFFEAVRLQPDCFEAYCQLGSIFRQLKRPEEALSCLRAAARLRPRTPKLNLLLGAVLRDQNRLEEAAACCRREIELHPRDADAHYNLGLVLQSLGEGPGAGQAYRRALELRPGYTDAQVNLGVVLRQERDFGAALDCFEKAVRGAPDHALAHWELGTTLLALGRFEQGWTEYEWRWKLADFLTPSLASAQPRWNGCPLQGRRILLHCEQGFGDTIQFARYARLVEARGGRVVLACPKPLSSIMATVPGVLEVATRRDALPPFDFQAPLLSLPAILGTVLDTIPADIPYVSPPGSDFHLPPSGGQSLRIGLAWAGDPAHRNDQNRSLPLECFRPLLEMRDTEWFSLQVGARAGDIQRTGLEQRMAYLGCRLQDFGDTAQAMTQLDLVISVDTAVAHLAGALGRRVWTLLPFEAEWRWMLDRPDTPWYPTMRLFRQSRKGGWNELLGRVGLELTRLLAEARLGTAKHPCSELRTATPTGTYSQTPNEKALQRKRDMQIIASPLV